MTRDLSHIYGMAEGYALIGMYSAALVAAYLGALALYHTGRSILSLYRKRKAKA